MRTRTIVSLLALLTTPAAEAFSTARSIQARAATSHTALDATSRKAFFQQVSSNAASVLSIATVVGTTMANPAFADADITSKLASSAAIRSVKSAQRKLLASADSATDLDYAAMREVLRVAPISDIRKACFTLVRAGADGADAEALSGTYKAFTNALEKMDNMAGQALRGRTFTVAEFKASYDGAVSSLEEFMTVAERSIADVPVVNAE